ncbi:flagellar hook-length control protein FliK [Thalassovita aquimarina]|uniref:Flagellar hook-length control protein FliK n=1 Tax=Thalassovita aquimarina TaxID=2785917 RepID=A0ABS5HKV7_9RHOB|nr:flagellar hook-length control protein FliK [Thalassovita aquimarina]MBR9649622.1 flagellar hook-length control protein FliK [Thalassovita aquimarina]
MPQTVTPASAAGAPSIFPANLSGIVARDREGSADFAELLQGSRKSAAAPGGQPTDGEAAANGETSASVETDAEGETPVDGETGLPEDGTALLPLAVLSGEAGDKAGLPSTIDRLKLTESSPAASNPGAGPAPDAVAAAIAGEAQGTSETVLSAAPSVAGKARADIVLGAVPETDAPAPASVARTGEAGTAVGTVQGDAAKSIETSTPLDTAQAALVSKATVQRVGMEENAGKGSATTIDAAAMAAQSPSQAAGKGASELARQLAPGQQVKPSIAEDAGDAPGAAIATAARLANGSLDEAAANDTAVTDETAAASHQSVKTAVQAALADAGRGRTAAVTAQLDTPAAQTPPASDQTARGSDSADPVLDGMTNEALALDTTAPEAEMMLKTMATHAITAAAAAQQAEAQASASAPQSGVVTVQAGEMGETVATAAPTASNAAPARTLQMVDPGWPTNLTSMIRAAQELGQSEIEIALQPEKLGKMTIRLDMRDSSNVAVNIVTESDAAARMLNDNQSRLAEMMQKAGFDLTQHQASSDQGFQGQNPHGGQAGRETHSETAMQQNLSEDGISAQSMQAGPDTGIDIIA